MCGNSHTSVRSRQVAAELRTLREQAGLSGAEVAFAGPVVALRDAKNPIGSVLALPLPAWRAFTTAVRHHEFG